MLSAKHYNRPVCFETSVLFEYLSGLYLIKTQSQPTLALTLTITLILTLVSSLLLSYTDNDADLLTEGSFHTAPWDPFQEPDGQSGASSLHDWCWHDSASDLFLHTIPDDTRRSTREHVQRFSSDCLWHLHCQSKRGLLGWSEMASITLVQVASSLRLDFFDAAHIGDPYSYDGKVTSREFRRLKRARVSQRKGPELLHALKW